MIETLRTGSAPGVSMPTIAWPPSWYAVRRRSSGLINTCRSAPSTMRSRASVKSDSSTCSWFLRAASSAASFARLARSAPTMPGVVEDVRTVGRADHDHVGGGVEPVHLGQDLVQRLLALVVAAAEAGHAGGARAADRVQLVDEHDRGRLGLGLREQVADARGADADDRLDELGRRHGEERRVGLAGHRPREQRLARAGRACEQDAVRDPPSEPAVLVRVLEEVDDFDQLLLGLLHAGHVLEGHFVAGGLVASGRRPAELAEDVLDV